MSALSVTEYDVVFALHTGVTVMMQKQPAFDIVSEDSLPFTLTAADIHIAPPGQSEIVIKKIKPDILAEIAERGFFMIYEFDGEDLARCTPCALLR